MFRFLFLMILLGSCAQSPTSSGPNTTVHSWGSMREALKMGRSEGRVFLDDAIDESTFGLGAMAELKGEITIIHGTVFIADASRGELILRPQTDNDQATLLITADVKEWVFHTVTGVDDYQGLEKAVADLCEAQGMNLQQPIPFWVDGVVSKIDLHVINGSCPIANPDGPEPWRTKQESIPVQLFGIYVEGAAGEFTHHGRSSHVHAIATGSKISGHVDGVGFQDSVTIGIPQKP